MKSLQEQIREVFKQHQDNSGTERLMSEIEEMVKERYRAGYTDGYSQGFEDCKTEISRTYNPKDRIL